MKNSRFVLRSMTPSLLVLPVLGIAALVVVLCSGSLQTEAGNASMPGFTTFDAPGAGTTASLLQGTSAFGINAGGDITGFETDATGIHHGFVRSAAGTFTEFDDS